MSGSEHAAGHLHVNYHLWEEEAFSEEGKRQMAVPFLLVWPGYACDRGTRLAHRKRASSGR